MEKVKNSQIKILVVDDEEGIRAGFAMLFKMYDYQVVVAPNGILAFRAFKTDSFNLVITDIHMPEGDGVTLIKNLKAVDKNIKIIAISGADVQGMNSLEAARSVGADIALTKPISTLKLVEVAQTLLE